jgi:hypothetical protein
MDECPKPKRHKKTGPTHGKVAALARHRPGSEEHAEAKREHKYRLAAETIENIKKMVAEWPPLTAEQRDRLSILLNGGEGA